MISFGALNVVAHPHPKGTYRQLFEAGGSARVGVRFWGDRFAKLTPISKSKDGVFTGRLATWVEVDRDENAIDTRSLEERLFDESGVIIPAGIGLNARVFNFAFNEITHTMIVETTNNENQSISISRARSAVESIMRMIGGGIVDDVDVYVKTERDAVDKIFSIPKLRKIEICLDLPNPDDLSEMEDEILRELEEMRTKRIKTEATKMSGADSLEPSSRYKAMAGLAKDNGHVTGWGRNLDNEKVELSTKEYPVEIFVGSDEESGAVAIRRLAREV